MEDSNPLGALYLQKQYHYRGCAKIYIHNLEFENEHVAGGRTIDPKNIARLVEVFESEGCHRLEAENHIPALIDDAFLENCLHESSIDHAALLDLQQEPPFLRLADGQQLIALHGKHRIKAAEKYLEPFDRWWVIDLYNSSRWQTAMPRIELTQIQHFLWMRCLTYEQNTPMHAASEMEMYTDIFATTRWPETSFKPASGKHERLRASSSTCNSSLRSGRLCVKLLTTSCPSLECGHLYSSAASPGYWG